MKLLQRLVHTNNEIAPLVLRLTLGLVMLPHGLQKTVGLFGGPGFSGEMQFFTEQMGIPWIFALAAIIAESLGALGLIVGALTRVSAFLVGTTMLVAAFMAHLSNGFFMNWFGNQKGEGFEYHLLAFGLAITLLVVGGGRFSADRLLLVVAKK